MNRREFLTAGLAPIVIHLPKASANQRLDADDVTWSAASGRWAPAWKRILDGEAKDFTGRAILYFENGAEAAKDFELEHIGHGILIPKGGPVTFPAVPADLCKVEAFRWIAYADGLEMGVFHTDLVDYIANGSDIIIYGLEVIIP